MFPGGGGEESSEDSAVAALGRAEDPSIDWMFPPPRHLSNQGTLEQVGYS